MANLVQFEEFLEVPRRLLKYFGIMSVKRENEIVFEEGILFYFAISNMILIVIFEFAYVCLSLAGKIHFDASEMMFIGICLCYMFWSLFKTLPLITNKQKIYDVLYELRRIHPTTTDEQEEHKIVECIKSMKTITLQYSGVLVTTVGVYSFTPFFDMIKLYFLTGEWNVDFTYYIWYPFNAYQRGVFELCFASHYYDAICAGVYILGGDLFMLGILTQISMQYDYMQRQYLSISYDQPIKRNAKLTELLRLQIRING